LEILSDILEREEGRDREMENVCKQCSLKTILNQTNKKPNPLLCIYVVTFIMFSNRLFLNNSSQL
jgi:hypothetical protein